jgi:hypothetical protein
MKLAPAMIATMSKLIMCGCGNHQVRTGNAVVWRGEHWDVSCAFRASVQTLQETNRKMDSLTKVIEKNECVVCNKPVGKRFTLLGDCVYHPNCLHDTGGEG